MEWRASARAATISALVTGVYAGWLRLRLRCWGATAEEVSGVFPGEQIVRGGTRSATMATTPDAPPEQVWP